MPCPSHRQLGSACILLLTHLICAPAFAQDVTAIAHVQTSRINLGPKLLLTFDGYLQRRLTSSAFQSKLRAIPPEQLQRARKALRNDPTLDCKASTCQLELGRLLAANKLLLPEIRNLAGSCMVSLTLFDVRSATSETAALSKGPCDQASIIGSLTEAIRKLEATLKSTATNHLADKKLVSVFISTNPALSISIDGQPKGRTPIRIDLEEGRAYKLDIGRWPYRHAETIVAEKWLHINRRIRPMKTSKSDLSTTSEWVGISLGAAMTSDRRGPWFTFSGRLATLKWQYLHWSILEGGIAVRSEGKGDAEESFRISSVGTRIGIPFYLTKKGNHQLIASLGLSYSTFKMPDTPFQKGFCLTPGLDYVSPFVGGTFPVGVGIRALIPTFGYFDGGRKPAFMLTINAGFSLTPMLRDYQRGLKSKRAKR
jgi:hypothetical protein